MESVEKLSPLFVDKSTRALYPVENVEKLSTIFVDSLLKRDEYVENVEKLSPLFVDNWLTSVMLWKMWKSCPQYLWIAC